MEQETNPNKPNPALAARAARLKREADAKEAEAEKIATPIVAAIMARIEPLFAKLEEKLEKRK